MKKFLYVLIKHIQITYLKKTNKRLDKGDTWFVYYAAGKVTKLFEIFEPQKFVCFHRLNTDKLKIYSYKKLRDYYGK